MASSFSCLSWPQARRGAASVPAAIAQNSRRPSMAFPPTGRAVARRRRFVVRHVTIFQRRATIALSFVIPGRREASSPESITTGGSDGLLRLSACEQETRHALSWRDQRSRATRLRASNEGDQRFHRPVRRRQAGLL